MMYWSDHMNAGWWVFSIVITILIAAFFVWAVLAVTHALGERGPGVPAGTPAGASARDVLDMRLAKGEITVDEYDRLRKSMEEGSRRKDAATAPPAPDPR